jgi:hypothetical protein
MNTTVILIIVLLLVGVGAYVWYTQQQQEEQGPPTPDPTQQTEPVESGDDGDQEDTPAAPTGDAVIKINGLVGWYDGPSYSEEERVWNDKSGEGNNITEISGMLNKSKNGEEVRGDVDSVVAFPEGLYDEDTGYTFISVAKYDGSAKGRIFTTVGGGNGNVLLGFHGGRAGVYHAGQAAGWLTERVNRHRDNWVLSVSQPDVYRSNGGLRTGYHSVGEFTGEVPVRIVINGYSTEPSDWSVKEMILYDRVLSEDEYLAIENALMDKYNLKPNRYEVSNLKGKLSEEQWPEVVGDVQFKCGKGEALTSFGMTDDIQSKYSCMSGIDITGSEVTGQTIYENVEDEAKYFKNLQNKKVDCGEKPINSLKLALDEDIEKIRFEYTCNNSKVKTNTCQSIASDSYDTGTSFKNVSGLTNTACPADHVITGAKLVADPEDDTKQKWEITCCKPKGI